MRLLMIRHGDPDYLKDSLTEKGWREAELLSNRIAYMGVKEIYMSPMGRAKDTASLTLKKMHRTGIILPWLREFYAPIMDEKSGKKHCPWDWLPAEWTRVDAYYDKDLWYKDATMQAGNVIKEAERVYTGLDEVLKRHGYEREGEIYRVARPNTDTIVLFCHFGVTCVMLSHLLGVSPIVLWQGLCSAPSSVTILTTEERRKGIACFRMNAFGDTSHLYAGKEEPSFAGRFCETYNNMDERHD
jgi:broad specificity phosphatase PhoE